ncbi:MAG: nucleotidyltransferase domain-containing protein [Candidatus Rokubacteria bacterium]|nr:nucleotidyltransferase domain-containing protein [Candidatus Rokubacteria bacterium]
MLRDLRDRPDVDKLERFLADLLERRGETLAFVVLFGSMARGDWSLGSDYDVFVGLAGEDRKRLIDRMAEFAASGGNIEVFPYSRSEWQHMFEDFHPLMLETLEHGVVLWDGGEFARMRGVFRRWRESGRVVPWRSGWKITDAPGDDRGALGTPGELAP